MIPSTNNIKPSSRVFSLAARTTHIRNSHAISIRFGDCFSRISCAVKTQFRPHNMLLTLQWFKFVYCSPISFSPSVTTKKIKEKERHIAFGNLLYTGKGKAVPLQAWSGPEGSRKLRFPNYMTTAQDGGKVVSLTHRPPLPPGNAPGTHFC
jgi:hypothetical protein